MLDLEDIQKTRTLCPIDDGDCGHVCTLYCEGGLHANVIYNAHPPDTVEQVWKQLEEERPHKRIVSWEQAKDAPRLGERQDYHLYRVDPELEENPHLYAYLVWSSGCPDSCPRIQASLS